MPKTVILLSGDLLFSSRIGSAAEQLGLRLVVASDGAAAVEIAEKEPPELLIIDLSPPGCKVDEIMSGWRQLDAAPSVLAYGPHVQEGRLEAARLAGCQQVLTRGQFDRQMIDVLRRVAESGS